MFEAKLWFYWDDNHNDYETIREDSIEDICEYVYRLHRDSPSRNARFDCGSCRYEEGHGILEASYALPDNCGCCYGSVWLVRITYTNEQGSKIVVYDRNVPYTSPKTLIVLNSFAEVARAREANKYGEW